MRYVKRNEAAWSLSIKKRVSGQICLPFQVARKMVLQVIAG